MHAVCFDSFLHFSFFILLSWGLVLSGGAAYGLANAGVLSVLEREGLRPDCVAGSSMGAIVGALYALTGSMERVMPLCDLLRMDNVARLSEQPLKGRTLHGGLLRPQLEKHLKGLLGDARIGDCAIPFVCVAGRVQEPIAWSRVVLPGFTDEVLRKVEPVAFGPDIRLLDAIMASSAIPVIFSPVVIDGSEYVDLVHFGAIPARTLKDMYHPDVLIATNTNPVYSTLMAYLPRSWNEFLERGYAELERSMAVCDLVITPELMSAPFRFDKARDFVAAGEKAAQGALPDVRRLLQKPA